MEASRSEQARYRAALAALLGALESGAGGEALEPATREAELACEAFAAALASRGACAEPELAELRRFAALAHAAAARAHAEAAERREGLRRARALLEHLDVRRTGAACDLSG